MRPGLCVLEINLLHVVYYAGESTVNHNTVVIKWVNISDTTELSQVPKAHYYWMTLTRLCIVQFQTLSLVAELSITYMRFGQRIGELGNVV